MREFLYSEIANYYGMSNIPDDPELAIYAGEQLCTQLLEPLNATFGRVAIRSSFRSEAVNDKGVRKHNCGLSKNNFARHGATACIAPPWFTDRYEKGSDWRALAFWIHDHLPYSEMEFFHGDGMCTFNLSWHEKPKKTTTNWIEPKRILLKNPPQRARPPPS